MNTQMDEVQKKAEYIVEQLNKKGKILFGKITDKAVKKYVCLKCDYAANKVQTECFHKEFRSFYGMIFWSRKRLEYYFKMMTDKEKILKKVLDALYQVPKGNGNKCVEFSFATKLIHTVDNNKPIYDSNVANVLEKRVRGNTGGERIEFCLEIYEFLEKLHQILLKEKTVKKLISVFRKQHKINSINMSDVKILDFLLWALGRK